jgi:hypothetical protein
MTIANLANDERDAEEVHQYGGTLAIVPFLQSDRVTLQDHALLALAGLGRICRTFLVENNIHQILLPLLRKTVEHLPFVSLSLSL